MTLICSIRLKIESSFLFLLTKLPILVACKTDVMKNKLFILAVAAFIFASCNKEYACNCSNPATGEENQMVFRTNQESHAERLCDDLQTRTRNAIPEKSGYTCTIQ